MKQVMLALRVILALIIVRAKYGSQKKSICNDELLILKVHYVRKSPSKHKHLFLQTYSKNVEVYLFINIYPEKCLTFFIVYQGCSMQPTKLRSAVLQNHITT